MTEFPFIKKNSPLICKANQYLGLYMIGTSVMKMLIMLLSSANLTSNYKYISSKMSAQKNLRNSLNFSMVFIISIAIIYCLIYATDISIFNVIIFTGLTKNVIDILCIIFLPENLLQTVQERF